MTRPLYCDESIWIPVADGLGQRGWTVHTARSEGLLGAGDREQLEYARNRDWILFTFDDDFLGLVEGEELPHPGVVYADQAGQRVGDIVRAVDEFLETVEPEWEGVHYL